MTTKTTTKRKTTRKTADIAITEPFAEVVEVAPAKKRAVKKASAVEEKPVKKTIRKVRKTAIVDPFAEVAVVEPTAKPAKKRVAKTVKTDTKLTEKKTKKTVTTRKKKVSLDVTAELAATEPQIELSPVFKALADVTLPELEKENRARLAMQSPTTLYFYWSLRDNPWHQLRAIFGDNLGSYALVVKLVDLTNDIEEIHRCEAEGNWWFAVEPGREYQAEIGFYAVNRPYFRVLYSNSIATPLRSPSSHPSDESCWTVSATKFAEVLDASGFSSDAFDVAMAGDDVDGSDKAARRAFSRFVDSGEYELDGLAGGDIRYAMAALAGGAALEELRWKVSERLFAILQSNTEKLNAESARSAMSEYFDIDEDEFTSEQMSPAVFGASLVHFPSTLKSRGRARYNPISSHTVS